MKAISNTLIIPTKYYKYRLRVFAIVFSLFTYTASAQNLVPNPSFENYNSCPSGRAAVQSLCASLPYSYIWYWSRRTPAACDYFNSCASASTGVSIPSNFLGTQSAHTGNAYTGFVTYNSGSYDGGCLQSELNTTLSAGHRYFVSFYINLADASSYASGDIGAYFTCCGACLSAASYFSYMPKVVSPPGFHDTDKTNWQQISGFFTAKGGEGYIVIGNIPDTTNAIYIGGTTSYAYYYIDDVSVVDSTYTDATICLSDSSVVIKASHPAHRLWNTGDTSKAISVSSAGIYWCVDSSSLEADTFRIKPARTGSKDTTIYFTSLPATITVSATPPGRYKWNTGDSTININVADTGKYWRKTIDSPCVNYTDTVFVRVANKEGFNNLMGKDQLTISPNPSTGLVCVPVTGNTKEVIVNNMTGIPVYRQAVSGNKEMVMDLSHLPKGIYFIEVKDADDKKFAMLVLQ